MSQSMRVHSVDALRGLTVGAMLVVNDAGNWDHVFPWLEHVAWHGCGLADYIFPFFLSIVGVSLALALSPELARGVSAGELARPVLLRGLRIVLLGLALHAFAWWVIPGRGMRPMGVLQRIGICYALAGMAVVYLRATWQWLLCAVLLLGHGGLLCLGGSMEPHLNLADRLDTWLLGSHAYVFDAASGHAQEPEGLLSTLGALASTLLGVRAGAWLLAGQRGRLWAMGALLLVLGVAGAVPIPMNKQLWTPTFVLWTSGAAFWLLALAHILVDRHGWPALGRSMGINAIVVYAGAWVAACLLAGTGTQTVLYTQLFLPLRPWLGEDGCSLAFALAFTAAGWGLMVWFARKGWRVSI